MREFPQGVMMAEVSVKKENPKYTIVKMSGEFDSSKVADTARTYQELIASGVARILIDLNDSKTNLNSLMSSREDLITLLARFEKVAILVPNADLAFKIKAASSHNNQRVKISYDPNEAHNWLEA